MMHPEHMWGNPPPRLHDLSDASLELVCHACWDMWPLFPGWSLNSASYQLDPVSMNEMQVMFDTFPLNNPSLLGHQTLLPMSTLFSKQPATARSEWALRGRIRGGGACRSPPPALLLELFFWSFMCRGSGQLRSSKNVLRGWWLFKPFCACRRDRHCAGICSPLTGVCPV